MRRRELLAAAALLGAPASASEPRRLVALEWNIVSMLLSLGVTPVGIPEIRAYGEWVVEPPVPRGAVDIGMRTEPNLEAIAALRPDLILTSPLNRLLAPRLALIAPVREVAIFTEEGQPLRLATRETQALGSLLGREAAAEREIAETEAAFTAARRLVGEAGRPSLLLSLLDPRHVRVFGRSSLFGDVLARIGQRNAWDGAVNLWGFAQVGVADLAAHPEARLIVVERAGAPSIGHPGRASLWTSLPAARAGRVARMPASWFYGDLAAARRFARFLPAAIGASP